MPRPQTNKVNDRLAVSSFAQEANEKIAYFLEAESDDGATTGGGGDNGGSGGGGGGSDGTDGAGVQVFGVRGVLVAEAFPSFKTAGELIRIVEIGEENSYSPLCLWEGEDAKEARAAAWKDEKNQKKQLKKLKTYFAMYALTKLSVHWGVLSLSSDVISKRLLEAAQGAFNPTSVQSSHAAAFLGSRPIPDALKMNKGGYTEIAEAIKCHVSGCTCSDGGTCVWPTS